MNKIFKVIWSKARGCYVVVSEIAKNNSKGGKKRARQLALAAIVGTGVALSTFTGVVYADGEEPGDTGSGTGATEKTIEQRVEDVEGKVTTIEKNISGVPAATEAANAAATTATTAADAANTAAANATTAAGKAETAAQSANDAATNVNSKVESAQAAATNAATSASKAETDAEEAKNLLKENFTEDGKAKSAVSADSATNATNDGNGKNIAETYATQEYVGTIPEGAKAISVVGYAQELADAEKTRAMGVEGDIQAALGAGFSETYTVTGAITTLQGIVGSEAVGETQATGLVKDVREVQAAIGEGGSVSTAIVAAQQAGVNAQNDVDTLKELVGTVADDKDQNTAFGKIAANADAIATEKTRAEGAEGALSERIGTASTEEQAATGLTAGVEKNKNDIAILNGDASTSGSVAKAISDVVGTLPEGSGTVAAAIAAEATRADEAEKANAKAISDEVTRATGAENALGVRIDGVNNTIGTNLSADGNYIVTTNSINKNLSALDSAIGALNADTTYAHINKANSVYENIIALDSTLTGITYVPGTAAEGETPATSAKTTVAHDLHVEGDANFAKDVAILGKLSVTDVTKIGEDITFTPGQPAIEEVPAVASTITVGEGVSMSADGKVRFGPADGNNITFDGTNGSVRFTNGTNTVAVDGAGTITGLSNTNWTTDPQKGYDAHRAATEGQLAEIANKGQTYLGQDATVGYSVPLGGSIRIAGDIKNIGESSEIDPTTANLTTSLDVTNGVLKINFKNNPVFETVNSEIAGVSVYVPQYKANSNEPILESNGNQRVVEHNATVTTVFSGNGIKISPKDSTTGNSIAGISDVTLTANGLSNGGHRITNVARGTEWNDVVIKDQLEEAKVTLEGAGSVTVTPGERAIGQPQKYVITGTDTNTTYEAGAGLKMEAGTNADHKFNLFYDSNVFSLIDSTDAEKNGQLTLNDKIVIGSGATITIDSSNSVISGLRGENLINDKYEVRDVTNTGNRAATESQLKNIIDSGFKVQGDSGTPTQVPLASTVKIAGGHNIVTQSDINGITIAETYTPSFNSVTINADQPDRHLFWNDLTSVRTKIAEHDAANRVTGVEPVYWKPGDTQVGYLSDISKYAWNGTSTQVATEAQLYNAVVNLDAADRYISELIQEGNTITIKQNNAPDYKFTIDTTHTEDRAIEGYLSLVEDKDDGNAGNWGVKQTNYDKDKNIIGETTYYTTVLDQSNSHGTPVAGGQNFTIKDTSGNQIQILDIASASSLSNAWTQINQDSAKIDEMYGGFKLTVEEQSDLKEKWDNIRGGDQIKFTTNDNTAGNLVISYDQASRGTSTEVRDNYIDLKIVDDPTFNKVTVKGGKDSSNTQLGDFVISGNGIGYLEHPGNDGEKPINYIDHAGLNAQNNYIRNVLSPKLSDSASATSTLAANMKTVYPVWNAIDKGINISSENGGTSLKLIYDMKQYDSADQDPVATNNNFGIIGGMTKAEPVKSGNPKIAIKKNIETSVSGNNVEISIVEQPTFTGLKIQNPDDSSRVVTIGLNGDRTDPTSKLVIDKLENTEWIVEGSSYVNGRAATEGQLKKLETNLLDRGANYTGDFGSGIHAKLGAQVFVSGNSNEGSLTKSDYTTAPNIGVNASGDRIQIQLAKNIDLTENGSLTVDSTKVNKTGFEVGNSQLTSNYLFIDNGYDTLDKRVSAYYTERGLSITRDTETAGGKANLAFEIGNISAGDEQIKNVASGIDGTKSSDSSDNFGANIGDIKKLATIIDSSTHIDVDDVSADPNKKEYSLSLKDDITLGTVASGNTIHIDAGANTNSGAITIGAADEVVLNKTGLSITDGPSVTTSGIDAGGARVTNVASGFTGEINSTVPQMNNAANIGDIVGLAKGSQNISIVGNADNTYTVDLKDFVVLDNSKTVNKLELSGTTGRITLTNAYNTSTNALVTGDETTGNTISATATIGVRPQGLSVHDEEFARLMYTYDLSGETKSHDAIIATLQDGIVFSGDNSTTKLAVDLSSQNRFLAITGGAATTNLTTGNIGVVGTSDPNNEGKNALAIKLNKDIDLTANGSLKIGGIVISAAGLTTGDTIHQAGVDVGGNAIYNMKSGIEIPKDNKGDPLYSLDHTRDENGLYAAGDGWDNNAASIGDVKEMATKVEAGKDKQKYSNLTISMDNTAKNTLQKTYTVSLNNVLKLGDGTANEQLIISSEKDAEGNYIRQISGLTNTAWETTSGKDARANHAATEGQLAQLAYGTNDNGGWGLNVGDSNTYVKTNIGKTLSIIGDTVDGDDNTPDNVHTTLLSDRSGVKISLSKKLTLGSGQATEAELINDPLKRDRYVEINGIDEKVGDSAANGGYIQIGQTDANKILLSGTTGTITAGDKVALNGKAGTGNIGNINFNTTTAGSTISGLANITWDPTKNYSDSGVAATEAQLAYVLSATKKDTDGTDINNPNGGWGLSAGGTANVKTNIGQTLAITGDSNITTAVVANQGISISLNREVNLGDGSLTIGNTTSSTVVSPTGVTITNSDNTSAPSMTTAGINAGGKVITNVASGQGNDNNAANIGDVKSLITTSETNSTDYRLVTNDVTSTQGATSGSYKVIDNKISLKVQDKNHIGQFETVVIEDVASAATLKGVTDSYIKDAIVSSDNKTLTLTKVADGVTSNIEFKGETDITYRANNATDTNAKTVTLSKGLNFVNGTNTIASVDDNGIVKVDLASEIDLGVSGAVTVGSATLDKDGLTVTNGPSVKVIGINAGNKKITSVASGLTKETGETVANSNNAANIGDVKALATAVTNGKNITVADPQADENGKLTYTVALADDIKLGTVAQDGSANIVLKGSDGTGNIGTIILDGTSGSADITGLSNTTWDQTSIYNAGRAATEEQLHSAIGTVNTAIAGLTSDLAGKTFGLADKDNKTLTSALNGTIKVVGDSNITTSIKDSEFNISLSDTIGLSDSGSLSFGTTKSTILTKKGLTIGTSSITETAINMGATVINSTGVATLGTDETKQIKLDGANGIISAGSGVSFNAAGTGSVGGIKFNQDADKATNTQHATTITGLTNTEWTTADGKFKADRAATEGQLKQAVETVNTALENKTFGIKAADGNTVTPKLGQTIEIVGANDNVSTKVEDGKVKIALNNNVDLTSNGSLSVGALTANSAGVTATAGTSSSLQVDADSTTITKGAGSDANTLKVDANGTTFTHGTGTSATATNINGSTITAGDKVTVNGSAGTIVADKVTIDGSAGTVSGLTNTEWDVTKINEYKNSTKAATEAQLAKIATQAGKSTKVESADSNIKISEVPSEAGSSYKVGLSNTLTVGDSNNDGSIIVASEEGSVAIAGKDGSITIARKDGTSAEIGVVNKEGATRIEYKDKDGNAQTVAILNDGMKYGGDSGEALNMKLNQQVNIKGGVSDSSKLSDGNIGVVADGNNTLNIKLSKELKGLEKVEVGDTTIDNKGLTVKGDGKKTKDITLKQGNVDMGGNVVSGIAPGKVSKDSTDAVNGAQMYAVAEAINNVGEGLNSVSAKVDKLGGRVNQVGARAAALAALHPLEFDPDEKLTFSAGYGHYHGESAGAIGAYYRPEEKILLSISGTMTNKENMFNAGISFALDRNPNGNSASRPVMARQIVELNNKVEALTQQNAEMMAAINNANTRQYTQNTFTRTDGNSMLTMVRMEFTNLPDGHWGYNFLKELINKGYLKPSDGNYEEGKNLTRYEFATALYRAIVNGAPVDNSMGKGMDEFGREMDNIAKANRFRKEMAN